MRITGGMENYFNTQWFSEGATEYYANLVLLRAGIIEFPLWLEKIQMHASMYLLFKRGAPYKSDLSLVEAGKDKWRNTPALYNGGAFVAFSLDSLIRQKSDNAHSLDDVMRYMDNEFGSKQRPFSVSDIPVAVKTSTGVDVSTFTDSYVSGVETINVEQYLSAVGLNADINQYEVYLTGPLTVDIWTTIGFPPQWILLLLSSNSSVASEHVSVSQWKGASPLELTSTPEW
jgi:predicted metalloprotease with PDZ domain